MTKGNRPPMRVQLLFIDAHYLHHGQCLRRKCLVDLDHIDVAQLHACTLQSLFHRRYRPDAHDIRSYTGDSHRNHTCQWLNTQFPRLLHRHQYNGGSAIVERAGIARGDRTTLDKGGVEAGKLLPRGVAAWPPIGLPQPALTGSYKHKLAFEDTVV